MRATCPLWRESMNSPGKAPVTQRGVWCEAIIILQWCHNECDGVSNTSLTIVYSAAYKKKHQSSASLAIVWGIHRWPRNSPHKGPVTRKMFPFDDVIMMGCYLRIVLPGKVVHITTLILFLVLVIRDGDILPLSLALIVELVNMAPMVQPWMDKVRKYYLHICKQIQHRA